MQRTLQQQHRGQDKIIQLRCNCMVILQQRANDFGWRFEHCSANEQCLQ